MIPILYLSHCGSNIGGGEKQLYYLVTNLDQNIYKPFVICPDEGVFAELLRDANIPTSILNLPPWRKTRYRFSRHKAVATLTKFCVKNNIRLIHTSDSWLNPYLVAVKQSLNIPVISHVRTLLTSDQIKKYAFDKMDYTISISHQSKIPLIESGIAHEKIDVVLNCVDLSKFKPAPKNQDKKHSSFIVGIVGRIEPFKDQKTFVEIASLVVKQCQNIRFHIIGSALNTPKHRVYESVVRQQVSKLKLDNVIHFTGHRDDIHIAMQELDVLVTLSAGSVIAEAMASGKPVIGTPIGSTSEMIIDGVTGWVIPIEQIEGIVEKIIQLYNDRNLWKQMGVAAEKHAENTFSITEHVHKVQDVYNRLLSDSI
ncbi:MAG: glycosyltransferase [Candidatus Poribacteria bacterium]|nr:glycosyltransferase [Candidatus Poribacteria bacterium]